MKGVRAAAFSLVVALPLGAVACARVTPASPSKAEGTRLEPRWQDAFAHEPELMLIVRPQAIKRDPVYGALFSSLVRLAKAKTDAADLTALAALLGAEEIRLGLDDPRADDAVLVVRGVPANLDLEKLVDASGEPLFRLRNARARVPEYALVRGANRAPSGEPAPSAFIVAERTWVFTLGSASERVRSAFSSPPPRGPKESDGSALASLRIDGPAFVRRRHLADSLAFGPLTRKLLTARVTLEPGKSGVVLALAYETEASGAEAELGARRLLELASHDADTEHGVGAWLKDAVVARSGKVVTVSVALPARLIDELPTATGADLPDEHTESYPRSGRVDQAP